MLKIQVKTYSVFVEVRIQTLFSMVVWLITSSGINQRISLFAEMLRIQRGIPDQNEIFNNSISRILSGIFYGIEKKCVSERKYICAEECKRVEPPFTTVQFHHVIGTVVTPRPLFLIFPFPITFLTSFLKCLFVLYRIPKKSAISAKNA